MFTDPRFFDRRAEVALFNRILTRNVDQRMLSFLIDGEQGKSWLLKHYVDICRDQGIDCAYVDFKVGENANIHYRTFLDRILEDLGDENFPRCQECLNDDTSLSLFNTETKDEPAGIHFGPLANLKDAEIGQVAGGSIANVHVDAPGIKELQAQRQAAQKERIGRCFRDELSQFTNRKPLAMILDAYEHVSDETHEWLEEWLLRPFNRKYPKLIVVIAGRPKIREYLNRRDAAWHPLYLEKTNLAPPSEDDVWEFVRNRYDEITVDWIMNGLLDTARLNIMSQFGQLLDIWETRYARS
jgi:hypothetical protein